MNDPPDTSLRRRRRLARIRSGQQSQPVAVRFRDLGRDPYSHLLLTLQSLLSQQARPCTSVQDVGDAIVPNISVNLCLQCRPQPPMATILVVDDEAAVRSTVARMLEETGHRVVLARNGKEALHRFAEEAVDLTLTDIVMPGMEGIETIRAIRQRDPKARVVAMSGADAVGVSYVLDMAGKFGAMASIAKPFRRADLLALIKACLSVSADRSLPPADLPDGVD